MGKFRENNRNQGFNRDRPSFGSGNRSFGGNRGGNRSFGGSRGGFGGGRDRFSRDGPKEMFDSVCSKCGKKCQLPFRPRGDKPVYCSACFETEGQTSPRFEKSAKPISNSGSSGISAEQFKQLNAKLDKILAILNELELDEEMLDEDLELEDDEDADEEDLEGDEEFDDSEEDDDEDFEDEEVVKK